VKSYSYGLCPYIYDNGIKVLLNKTSLCSDFNFFKGKIEEGETIKLCAQREFLEEYGVLVNLDDFEDYFYQTSRHKDIGIFLVNFTKYENKSVKNREIYSSSFESLDKVVLSKNQRKLQNQIIYRLKEIERWNVHLNLF